jgi:ABC-type transport system substrate-binding protein
MRSKRFHLIWILILGLTFFGSMPTGAAQSNVLRVGVNSDLDTLDPARIRNVASLLVGNNIYSSLVRFKPGSTTEIEPDLAKSWELSSDGLVMTFHLRKGVQFQKGFGEFTAEDAKFTIERHQNKATKSAFFQMYKAVKKVEAVDKYTLRLHFTAPTPAFLPTILTWRGGWILSKKAVEKFGKDYAFNPVGTGTYVFQSYQKGAKVVLTANKDYFRGQPHIGRVEFIPVPEASVAYAAIQAGDLDIMYTRNPTVFNRARKNKDLKVMFKPAMSVRSAYLNTSRGPLKDVRVRRAIVHAVNRKAILEHVLGNTGRLGSSILNPNTWTFTTDIRKYAYDPARAKKLLAEAGYAKGFEVEFLYPKQSPYQEIAPAMADDLRAVGIKANLIGMKFVSFIERARKGGYDMLVMGLTRPPDPEIVLTTGYFGPNKPPGQNFSFYDKLDKVIVEARHEVNREKRKQLYVQAQKRIAEDVPVFPFYYPYAMSIMRPHVKGHVVGVMNAYDIFPMYLEQ